MRNLTICLLLIVFALSAFGQSDSRTAEEVVRDYNEYVKKQDWHGIAALIHPDSLAGFRGMFATMIEKDPASGVILGIKSKGELASITDAQIFERLFSTVYKTSPELATVMKNMEIIVIGSVDETSDLRHFIYRATFRFRETPISKPEIYSLKRHESSWRVLMSDAEIRAVTDGLSAIKPTAPTKKAVRAKKKVR